MSKNSQWINVISRESGITRSVASKDGTTAGFLDDTANPADNILYSSEKTNEVINESVANAALENATKADADQGTY